MLAIVAILAGLLLPVLAKAPSAACQNNLHQMGLSLTLYVSDYHWYPRHGVQSVTNPFGAQFGEYVSGAKRVFICPAHKRAIQTTNALTFGEFVAFSYGYNCWGAGGNAGDGITAAGLDCFLPEGHVEYGRKRKWVEHKDEVMRRWNRDNQPHPETWGVNLMEYEY